jgi:5-formyltetrahydrofolate cyclo-ligase
MSDAVVDVQDVKKKLREEAHARRNGQENKDELSAAICERVLAMPEYARARTVMWYVDVRSEVRTRNHLAAALAGVQRRRGTRTVPPRLDGRAGDRHVPDP